MCVYENVDELYVAVSCDGCPAYDKCSSNNRVDEAIIDFVKKCVDYGWKGLWGDE